MNASSYTSNNNANLIEEKEIFFNKSLNSQTLIQNNSHIQSNLASSNLQINQNSFIQHSKTEAQAADHISIKSNQLLKNEFNNTNTFRTNREKETPRDNTRDISSISVRSNQHLQREKGDNASREGILPPNNKSANTIVARIDNIYLSIKDTPKYYTKLRFLIFIISIFSMSFTWMVLSITTLPKNKYYCLDAFSREIKLCDQSEFCATNDKSINYVVFIDDENIVNKDILTEIHNINKKYLNYFLKDGLTFSLQNAKFDRYAEVDTLYNIVFAISYKEKWNLFTAFSQYCKRQLVMSQLCIALIISYVLGNFIWGFLADIFGRKKVIIGMGIVQFLGTLIIFCTCSYIISTGQPEQNTDTLNVNKETNLTSNSNISNIIDTQNFTNFSYDTSRSFLFDYKTDQNISDYLNKKFDTFENQNLNQLYIDQFNSNIQLLINHKFISKNFSKYKFFVFLGFIMIFLCTSATSNITLAYLLENSINDTEIYNNYVFWHYTIPLSYLVHFILLTMINNFHVPMLICGVITLTASLLLGFLLFESPRHHYEFFEYKEITKLFENIFGKVLIEKFYRSEEIPRFRKEILKQVKKVDYIEVLCNHVIFLGYGARQMRYKELVLQNKLVEVRRYEILRNPFLLFLLISKNKQVKKNLLIIVSLVAIIGFIFNLTVCKYNLNLVFSRESLYTNIIVNQVVFYLIITMILSLYVFNFILKFFGFSIILFICFAMIFIFSLLFELFSLGSRNFEDMNIYTYNSVDIIFERRGATLLTFLFVVTFFATGVYGVMFFYLTKLTKTLYRGTFYGVFRCILDFTMLFSIALSQYFEKNFFYVSVLSVIGFVNAYFIKEDFDFTLVADFRQIEFEDD
jgi:hypothetical protein